MFSYLIVFGAGLVVGWNFLPQPEIVQRGVKFVVEWFRNLRNGD